MKSLIWIIVLFAIAAGLAIGANYYVGNIYIYIGHTLVRMNLNLFVVGLIFAVSLLYFFNKLLFGVLATPGKIGRFGSTRKYRKAVEALNNAGVAFFEGRYPKAAHEAAKVLSNKHAGDNRVLALIIAAQAARQNGDSKLLVRYLDDISVSLPAKAQLPRYLLSAEYALSKGDFADAKSNLNAAEDIDRHLNILMQLQLRVAMAKGDAEDILDKADKLQKVAVLSEDEALTYREQAYQILLDHANDANALKNMLKRLPNAQKAGNLCVPIAQRYEKLGLYSEAAAWVNNYYPHTGASELLGVLLRSVRYLNDSEQRKIIDNAESWLKNRPEDAELLRYLGELAYSKQLWGKAQGYFEASIAIHPSVQARLGLAKVFDEIQATALADEQRQLAFGAMAKQN